MGNKLHCDLSNGSRTGQSIYQLGYGLYDPKSELYFPKRQEKSLFLEVPDQLYGPSGLLFRVSHETLIFVHSFYSSTPFKTRRKFDLQDVRFS